jgi:glycosyltransferase involved in cell wall biosynthesis
MEHDSSRARPSAERASLGALSSGASTERNAAASETRLAERAPNDARRLSILALEPWMRGSHEQFLARWRRDSRHDVRVIGLAGRDWKWRMRASSHELAQRIAREKIEAPDVLFASDFVDVPGLYGWLPPSWGGVPCVLYFHENQLTYPLAPGVEPSERDLHFAFTNALSALRASHVVFNSRYHRDDFARAADEMLARAPRPNPRAALRAALANADVIAPGIDLAEIALGKGAEDGAPLRVVFNHRWEHDKDPPAFLGAVRDALRQGARLELVLLGESFDVLPPGAAELLDELEPTVRERGFADRARYADLLARCDVVVSTARHEFFGIALAEAMAAGCTPLAPARLSYPELVPSELHARCLYRDADDLAVRMHDAASNPRAFRANVPDGTRTIGAEMRARMRAAIEPFAADRCAQRLDDLVAIAARGRGRETRETSDTSVG